MNEKKTNPFDINDVIGENQPPIKPQTNIPTYPEVTTNKTGTMICIPCGPRFKDVDIAHCSDMEFIAWLEFVLPVEKNFVSSEVNNISKKIELLKRVESFHSNMLFARKPKLLNNN